MEYVHGGQERDGWGGGERGWRVERGRGGERMRGEGKGERERMEGGEGGEEGRRR
jgi:hypothetical protein